LGRNAALSSPAFPFFFSIWILHPMAISSFFLPITSISSLQNIESRGAAGRTADQEPRLLLSTAFFTLILFFLFSSSAFHCQEASVIEYIRGRNFESFSAGNMERVSRIALLPLLSFFSFSTLSFFLFPPLPSIPAGFGPEDLERRLTVLEEMRLHYIAPPSSFPFLPFFFLSPCSFPPSSFPALSAARTAISESGMETVIFLA